MKIELSKEQYLRLVELVYLGNWLMNAHRVADDHLEEYDESEQQFLSFCKKFGDNDIQYDAKYKTYYISREQEDKLGEFIKDYDDATFWDELADRLGDRDTLASNREPTIEEVLANRNKYHEEIAKNGLRRVKVDWDQP